MTVNPEPSGLAVLQDIAAFVEGSRYVLQAGVIDGMNLSRLWFLHTTAAISKHCLYWVDAIHSPTCVKMIFY